MFMDMNIKKWNNDDHCKLKKCKNNIITKSTKHFSSKGYCYSFGNRGRFDCINNCSVGLYATKKEQEDLGNELELCCAKEIEQAVGSIAKFLPNIQLFISPLLQSVSHHFTKNGLKKILTEVPTSRDGCWQTCISVNAETLQCHNEKDCSYTIIYVPDQEQVN